MNKVDKNRHVSNISYTELTHTTGVIPDVIRFDKKCRPSLEGNISFLRFAILCLT